MIEFHYDPKADATMLSFAKGAKIDHTDEVAPGVLLDFAADGTVIGVEVLYVRKRMALADADKAEERPAAE